MSQCTGALEVGSRSGNTLYTPSRPFSSAVRWLITMSQTEVMPCFFNSEVKVTKSAFVPYELKSRLNNRPGRYPSGDTLCEGGGKPDVGHA